MSIIERLKGTQDIKMLQAEIKFGCCTDTEAGMIDPDGTSPRDSNRYYRTVGGGKEEHGARTGRVSNNHIRGGHNASTRGTNKKIHAHPSQRKGTYTQVP
jgi:hypothetical protein